MCVLDCDKFKQINDTYGHIVGDKVLIAIASKMQEICRKDDVVLRLGAVFFCENSRETFDSLYRKADQMLYESKKVHGFCARIYKEER